jgi:phospho-N-acetylmuramoyl-pentapeptide-transferase
MEKIFGFAMLSFFVSAILLVPFIDFMYKMKIQRQIQKTRDPFNKPTPIFDKHHAWKAGTPIAGGALIILVVTLVTLWAYGLFSVEVNFWELFVLLFSFIGFGALGLYDDLKKIFHVKPEGFFGLRARQKFAIQWVLALIIGSVFYFKLGYSFLFIHWIGQFNLGPVYIIFAAFTIVSFVNAFNITDGLDGLGRANAGSNVFALATGQRGRFFDNCAVVLQAEIAINFGFGIVMTEHDR